ncbi:hypothetical protein Godav_028679 [Gossypium davidsonii]|uniref:MADS-box domain-containing protein n=2 Tax=Gossypium TaxID=3633 RepID=A0A7J8S063_GOSDV|nr:hypothetical protein [Gossypium davidsonii]MBA0654880.1 hypothetical protein [Gossypium klotzschianum]
MRRKKVMLARIPNGSARRACLKKRRLRLMKKMSELTILYGGNTYHVIYCPDESELILWSSHSEVQQKLDEYRKTHKLDQLKKMLRKLQRRNNEVEMDHLMHQFEQGKGFDEFNNEHTIGDIVAQDNLGLLPGHTLGGKSDVGVPLYGYLRGTTTDMGQQLLDFKPFGSGAIENGLPRGSTIGSSTIFGAFGNNIRMGGNGEFRGAGMSFGLLKWKICFLVS